MYEEFFHLTCRPFDLAPDPRFLYLTDQHSRAVANVRFALMNHDSFVVITGEIGTGKTTVLNAALEQLGAQYVVARLSHTTLSDIELLQCLLSEFGIPDYGNRKVKLLDELRAYFLEQHLAGRHVVIIVDEAQHLSSAAIEELRLLSCIDARDRRIVTIALTGQPTLDDVIDEDSLAPLRQRTRLRQRLRPMGEADTEAYIRHRIQVAGGDADAMFEPDTFAEIHRLTLGTPRLINTLCDSALMVCRVDGRERVNMETLVNVVQDLGWRWESTTPRMRKPAESMPAPVPGEKHAWLRCFSHGKLVAKAELKDLPFTVGRGHGNGLVLLEKEVSRRHVLIDRVGGRYIVEDLHSINGMMVNARSCDTAVLKSGDVITVGLVNLIFSLDDEHEERTSDDDRDTARGLAAVTETQLLDDAEKLPLGDGAEVTELPKRKAR
jgi:type II secretory pathway predicted ATPase ExeA